jgi:hypothetical protein
MPEQVRKMLDHLFAEDDDVFARQTAAFVANEKRKQDQVPVFVFKRGGQPTPTKQLEQRG